MGRERQHRDVSRDLGRTGKFGKALEFNGTSARVNVPDAASSAFDDGDDAGGVGQSSTLNANWRDVIYKGNDNYYLEATSSNASKPDAGLIAGGAYADVYGTTVLPANTWSYLAETYDGSTVRLYVNGTQVGSVAHTGAITTSTNQLQIGGDSLYGQYFAGMIDDVRIYNTALTAAQIQADRPHRSTQPGRTRRRRRSRARCRRRRSRPARSTCPGVARATTLA